MSATLMKEQLTTVDINEGNENLQSSISTTAVNLSSSNGGETTTLLPSTSSFPHSLEEHCRHLEEENQNLKDAELRLQQQHADSQRRERILMRRLANKEQELQDYISQIAEYKAGQAPGPTALRSTLLDPAVNILFEKLKHELQSTRAKLEETQNELSAWKFTPDSNTGKRLMAKCRLLYQENEELGKLTSNGRLAKLETELAMQKSFSEEVKKSQSELDDFLQELDEDVEGMQSTILFLQQELKVSKDRIQNLENENFQLENVLKSLSENGMHLANGVNSPTRSITDEKFNKIHISSVDRTTKINLVNFLTQNNSVSVNCNSMNINEDENLRKNITSIKNFVNGNEIINTSVDDDDSLQTDIINSAAENNAETSNLNSVTHNIKVIKNQNQRKRNYDSDSSENSSANDSCTLRNNKKLKKKARRSSVLSIDLNEDTQIAEESEEIEVTAINQRILTRRKSTRNQYNGEHN